MDVWFFDKGADFGTGSPLGELIWGMAMYAMLVSCLLGSSPSPGPPKLPTQRPASVSCHDIAGIWVAFFSRCQRYRCQQEASQPLLPGGASQSEGQEGFTVPAQAEGEADDVSAHLLCAQLPPIRSGFVAINRRIL